LLRLSDYELNKTICLSKRIQRYVIRDWIDLKPCSAQSWHRPSIISGAMNTRWRVDHHHCSHYIPSASTHYKTFRCCVFCNISLPARLFQVFHTFLSGFWSDFSDFPSLMKCNTLSIYRSQKIGVLFFRNLGLVWGEVLPVCVFPIPSLKEKYTHRITVNCSGL